MSLLIGRVHAGKIYILGDTALTFYNNRTSNPFIDGCLKQYIVTNKIAIAFAGIREHFETICPQLLAYPHSKKLSEIASEAQRKGMHFDLLIGEVGNPELTFVKNGTISYSAAGYIGDSAAFQAFQEYYHSPDTKWLLDPIPGGAQFWGMRLPEPLAEGDIYPYLFSTFKRVIWDQRIPSVGGVIVPLCTDKGMFRYMNYFDVISDPLRIEEFTDKPKAIEFGTPGGGGYSVEFNDDRPQGKGRNLGLYFLQGGFGVIFPRSASGLRTAQLVKAKNPAWWVLETAGLLGHGIGSGFVTEDHCGMAGEELLTTGRWQDALFCYQLRRNSQTLAAAPAKKDRYLAGYATAMFNGGQQEDAIALLRTWIKELPADSRRGQETLQKMLDTRIHQS